METVPGWSVVIPVKPLAMAKTRLALDVASRVEVVLAMAVDTTAAALRCRRVRRVLVVSDDERATTELRALGATVVPDLPDAGLNPALEHGARLAAATLPDCGVATLSADLPALRAGELADALDAAARVPLALVADRAGTGTTLLTARPGVPLRPAYGPASRERHVALGHRPLDIAGIDSVRLDVDTLDDLAAVGRLGPGARTAVALSALSLPLS